MAATTYDYTELRDRITYEGCREVLQQYRCNVCDAVFNVPAEKYRRAWSEGGLGMRHPAGVHPVASALTHYATSIAPGVREDYREQFAVACPACGACGWSSLAGYAGMHPATSATQRTITGRYAGQACDDVCAEATGNNCQCQCGGLNHGTSGRGA